MKLAKIIDKQYSVGNLSTFAKQTCLNLKSQIDVRQKRAGKLICLLVSKPPT